MLRRARGTWAALAFGSTVTVGLVFGTVCSVDRAGLSNGDASVSSGGLGGGMSSGLGGLGSGGGSGGTGKGGNGGSGGVGSGSGGAGQGGGPGGQATGGINGTGGAMSGDGGPGVTGGTTGAGGVTGTGGLIGTGGALGTGGATATGGVMGTGGAGGTGGGHPPSCAPFPTGSSFTTPTDGLLHCYWIHSDATDWTSSESRCVSEGGTLATILSSQENMFVLQILLQGNLFKGEGVSLGATDGKSSSDKSGPGQYAWVTGEPWGYHNWHQDQPSGTCTCQGFNNTGCTCNHWLTMINDGTWIDAGGSSTRPSICEAVAR